MNFTMIEYDQDARRMCYSGTIRFDNATDSDIHTISMASRKIFTADDLFKDLEDRGVIETDTYVKSVIYNNPATIVFWSDGTKTISKVSEGEEFSKEIGLAMCCAKKMFNSRSHFMKCIKDAKDEAEEVKDDVR